MILLHNNPYLENELSPYAQFIGKRNLNAVKQKYDKRLFSSKGVGWIEIPEGDLDELHSMKDNISSDVADNPYWTAADSMLLVAAQKLPRFLETLTNFAVSILGEQFPLEGLTLEGPTALRPSRHPTIWGAATLKWLVDNRNSRTDLNDYLFAAMCAREAGWARVQPYSPSYEGNPAVSGLRKAINVSTSPAWVADIAHVNGETVPGCAIGFGQRQKGWWDGVFSGYRGAPGLTSSGYLDVWYGLGCLPWWAQALFTARDIQTLGTRHSYLLAGTKVPEDPTFRECYYPYYLLEQPALNKRSIKRMLADSAISRPQELFAAENAAIDFASILVAGLPTSLSGSSILFGDELNDQQWLTLVTGVSNHDVLEIDIANIGSESIRTPDMRSKSLGVIFDVAGLQSASSIRSSCNSGKWTPVFGDAVTNVRSTYHFSRNINLF